MVVRNQCQLTNAANIGVSSADYPAPGDHLRRDGPQMLRTVSNTLVFMISKSIVYISLVSVQVALATAPVLVAVALPGSGIPCRDNYQHGRTTSRKIQMRSERLECPPGGY